GKRRGVRLARAGRDPPGAGAVLQPLRGCCPMPGGALVRDVTLVGGGLAGSLLPLLLARRGLAVTVYERRADARVDQIEEGRSINLALSARGIHALSLVGLDREVLARAIPMRGRFIHPAS